MSAKLTVGVLARRAGVTPKTVRYYEAIGLLPPPRRDPNGYRRYEPDHENRLAFIRRAKALGLTLSEIRELVSVAEHGRCGSTQAELREILDRKIADCTSRIEELTQLRTSLQGAAARLTPHSTAPAGTCCPTTSPFSPHCNCVPAVERPLDLTVRGKV